MAGSKPHPDWRSDEKDGPCPEKDYKEWDGYFHPDIDFDASDILFYRAKLEKEAEMSTSSARQRYGKIQSTRELG